MTEQQPSKWRHFQVDMILLCVRWYLRYSLSYWDLEEMILEPNDERRPQSQGRCRAGH